MIYRKDVQDSPRMAVDDLREVLTAPALQQGEWEVWPLANGILTFWRIGPFPYGQEDGPWLRGYLDMATGEWEISDVPADLEHGTMFPHIRPYLDVFHGADGPVKRKEEDAA